MDFAPDDVTVEHRDRLLSFMDSHVYPAETVVHETPTEVKRVVADLQAEARRRGLWNLFRELSNLQYAPLAEIMGRSGLASVATNCAAPDTGNMEVLEQFGTPEQRKQWLEPLLNGEIRSAFSMSEPTGGSDPLTFTTRAAAEEFIASDPFVVNGVVASWAVRPWNEVLQP